MHGLTKVSGGGNGLSIFPTGVHYDIPVVDGDAMGRAYPTMYQGNIPIPVITHFQKARTNISMYSATLSVYGHPLTPCALSDARGNVSVVMVIVFSRNDLCSLLN